MPTKPLQAADELIDIAVGKASPVLVENERRRRRRLQYTEPVVVVMIGPTGHCAQPVALRARDLSYDGICVCSRTMMYPGSRGAVQLKRSTGEMAIIGVQVQHCRYAGAMQHYVGMKFVPLTEEIPSAAFLDRRGRMIALDESVNNNRK